MIKIIFASIISLNILACLSDLNTTLSHYYIDANTHLLNTKQCNMLNSIVLKKVKNFRNSTNKQNQYQVLYKSADKQVSIQIQQFKANNELHGQIQIHVSED